MSRWRWDRLAFAAGCLLAVALLVVIFWRYLILAGLTYAGWRYFKHKVLGIKARPKSSWSNNLKALAALIAAWNTRWIRHGLNINSPRKTEGVITNPDGTSQVSPYDWTHDLPLDY